jgi:O-antigen ligase/tetratricopeptide (TPR) repeat protein
MRSQRLTFVFLAFYLIFIGGSAYYTFILPVRLVHHALMCILMGIWYYRKWRGDGIPHTPVNIALLMMCVVWLLSAIFGHEPRNSIESLWFIFLHVTLFFVLVDFFQRGRGRLVIETQFIMGAVVILFSVIEIASWYFGLGITPNTQVGWADVRLIPLEPIRLALAMNISTLLAGYVAPLILLTLGWALTARRRDYRQALWMVAGALFIILILTFSRGGLLSLGIGLGAFFAMRIFGDKKRASIRKWLIPITIIGGIGAVVIFTISQARSTGDEVRLDMYRSAVQITLDNPIVGVGVGNFGRAYREYRTPDLARDRMASAHNLYLNTIAETGLTGLIIGIGLAGVLFITWWRVWRAQDTPQRKIRHEITIAALLGVGAHSMVDVFSTTPLVSLILLLLAYSITGHRTVLSERPHGKKFPALVAMIITIGYAIFFIQTDRAYVAYIASWRDDEQALANAQIAQSLDPELNLYTLQIAYLSKTIDAYQTAVVAEPTWDVGWMNLAYLYEQAENYDNALEALWIAKGINPISPVQFNIGRIGEAYAQLDDETIIEHYVMTLILYPTTRRADYWSQTDLRRRALEQYITERATSDPIGVYTVIASHFPDRLAGFTPQNPQTAPEWWMVGEYALSVEKDAERAIQAFSRAVDLAPTDGDYYLARARAIFALGGDATTDLNYAILLGTRYESIPLLHADIAERNGDAELAEDLRQSAYRRVVSGEFAGVLYHGRFGAFDLPNTMHPPQ